MYAKRPTLNTKTLARSLTIKLQTEKRLLAEKHLLKKRFECYKQAAGKFAHIFTYYNRVGFTWTLTGF